MTAFDVSSGTGLYFSNLPYRPKAAAFRSIVLQYTGAPTVTCLFFFGDVAFSEYFLYHMYHYFRFLFVWTIEYLVRSFLPNGVFQPCDHGLDFLHQLIYMRIQSINQSINQRYYQVDYIPCLVVVVVLFTSTDRASTIPSIYVVANPVHGHKEVPRSTGHIMVTTRYSDQQGSKPRQKVMRLYKR